MGHGVRVIDSHTGGEPTRVVIAGGPDLGQGQPRRAARRCFRSEHDRFRTAIVSEPRGHDALVGAPARATPHEPGVRGRRHLLRQRRLPGHVRPRHDRPGRRRSRIWAASARACTASTRRSAWSSRRAARGRAASAIGNVPELPRGARDVRVARARARRRRGRRGLGRQLVLPGPRARPRHLRWPTLAALTAFTVGVRDALRAAGVAGEDGADVDHVELFGPSPRRRQPQLRALPRRGLRPLALRHGHERQAGLPRGRRRACVPGDVWRQESVTGSVFEALVRAGRGAGSGSGPRITGRAHVTGRGDAVARRGRPARWGMRARRGPTTSWSSAAASSASARRYYAARARPARHRARARRARRRGLLVRQRGHDRAQPHRAAGRARDGGARPALHAGPGEPVLRAAARRAASCCAGAVRFWRAANARCRSRARRRCCATCTWPAAPASRSSRKTWADFGLVERGLLMLCRTAHGLDEEARGGRRSRGRWACPREVLDRGAGPGPGAGPAALTWRAASTIRWTRTRRRRA